MAVLLLLTSVVSPSTTSELRDEPRELRSSGIRFSLTASWISFNSVLCDVKTAATFSKAFVDVGKLSDVSSIRDPELTS